jgi:hypothetical protein
LFLGIICCAAGGLNESFQKKVLSKYHGFYTKSNFLGFISDKKMPVKAANRDRLKQQTNQRAKMYGFGSVTVQVNSL